LNEEQIFLDALELANPAEQLAFLDRACGRDGEVRRHVENLLAAHFRPGPFLNQSVGEQLESRSTDSLANPSETVANESAAAEQAADQPAADLYFLQPSTRPGALGRIGHYEVLEVLGRGGFGIVFRAFDDVLQRVVALKVLAPAIAATSPARKRFLREARSSAQVRHENVVQVYAVDEQPLPYLVMEYIPGETLQQRLNRVGPLDAREIVRLARQLAAGLAAAHGTGLIHRDIKPSNILIEEGQERVKITDFGLALAADDASMTQSGLLAGTPIFMAPEQAKGAPLDHRTDLFSLGSVLYALAAGRPPFRAATTYAVLKRVVEDTPRSIRELMPDLPQGLADIISKLHAKRPEDRFQSARELGDVLDHYEQQLNSKLGVVSPAPVDPVKIAASSRWKWGFAALLVPCFILITAEIVGLTNWSRSRQSQLDPPDSRVLVPEIVPQIPEVPKPRTDYTNSLGMKFKLIPAGKFRMGTSAAEIENFANPIPDPVLKWMLQAEGPEHEVEITRPFYLGAMEVTLGQFRQFVTQKNYQVGDDLWQTRGAQQTEDHPVAWVNWNNAVDFCNWLSEKEGQTYRLPTEAEWEYACRAGRSGTRYCYGDDAGLLQDYAWNYLNSGRHARPVGQRKPNDWGLHDMHGNVWEWCQDKYDPNFYHHSPLKDPIPPEPTDNRVQRGGSWEYGALECRSAFRSYTPLDRRTEQRGFRVLLVSNNQ
jgi:formylglycine-generating enzyme required for sulfatase activity/predicted Ser/Thr protein kinase